MIRRPPRSTLRPSSAASDVYKRQGCKTPSYLLSLSCSYYALTILFLVCFFPPWTEVGQFGVATSREKHSAFKRVGFRVGSETEKAAWLLPGYGCPQAVWALCNAPPLDHSLAGPPSFGRTRVRSVQLLYCVWSLPLFIQKPFWCIVRYIRLAQT